ncbi:MAG: hypothetical protein VB078_08935 [Clostridiaceae bacterium]|nr:hypothetical protein [Clostridiaceae bacterium]
MTDGIYDVILKSPLGLKMGTLALSFQSGILKGSLTFFGKENPIRAGIVDGNTCKFTGNIITAAGEREYKANVIISGEELHGEAVFYLRTIPVKIPMLIPMRLTGKRKA